MGNSRALPVLPFFIDGDFLLFVCKTRRGSRLSASQKCLECDRWEKEIVEDNRSFEQAFETSDCNIVAVPPAGNGKNLGTIRSQGNGIGKVCGERRLCEMN